MDAEIQKLCQSHQDFSIFNSFPGAGKVFTPRWITAFGTDRQRFQSSDEVLKYSGIAPVLERSGKKTWVHWRYACPKFLRQTFVEWAGETIHRSVWAKTYYHQRRQKGQTHPAAVRALAFKWIRILYRRWQKKIPYDEQIYLIALKKHHSPLLENRSV